MRIEHVGEILNREITMNTDDCHRQPKKETAASPQCDFPKNDVENISNQSPSHCNDKCKNRMAIIALILAILSLLPCIGVILGFFAIFFGFLGLRRFKQLPQIKGNLSAWAGILLGGFTITLHILVIILSIILYSQSNHDSHNHHRSHHHLWDVFD